MKINIKKGFLKWLLDVSPHIEKALYFSGIAITLFSVMPVLLEKGEMYFALGQIVMWGLLVLSLFQIILFVFNSEQK